MRIRVLPGVYPPSEDTFFLASRLEEIPLDGARVLDLGTGSGYLAVLAALRGARVTAVDIQPKAILNARLNARLNDVRISTRLSDLFENVRGRFDVVVFNPPYLSPWEEVNDPAWDGGVPTILRFLEEVEEYLAPGGRYLLVLEEGPEWEQIKKSLPRCVRVRRNAFHLLLLEGRACQ
ncbi:MAG: methyltransferase [Candidatus Diapherotrites archaeon]|nr:methyltransferase [Candidatus Diapherotrites archaeon]